VTDPDCSFRRPAEGNGSMSPAPVPATFGHGCSAPVRVALPAPLSQGLIWAKSAPPFSLDLIGLRANERRCNGLSLVSRPEMEGDG
jgi:hypothetical protein